MSRNKKSRKPGAIGVPKSPSFTEKAKHKKKPTKGRPSGSRHNVESTSIKATSRTTNTDPRHGSKKSIPLVKAAAKKVTYATPKQELAALEADARLISLLDKQEQGIHLSVEQKAYVTEKLDRHAVLCSLLGIELEQEEKTTQDDPLDSLDAISMSDFIDSSDEQ